MAAILAQWKHRGQAGAALAVLALVAGCASSPPPRSGGATSAPRPAPVPSMPRGADGPGANPPADLVSVPDAEPRVETVRPGGANKPYQALGREYVPALADKPFVERGLASWYGRKFHGQRTSSGEIYDMYAMTAAHPTLPIPSYARIRNPANGRVVIVRVNDRGPFHAGRIVDLSYTAALKLDLLRGVAPVELERITSEEIRAGTWRRDGDGDGATRLAAAPRGVTVATGDVALVSIAAPTSPSTAPSTATSAVTPTPTPTPTSTTTPTATATATATATSTATPMSIPAPRSLSATGTVPASASASATPPSATPSGEPAPATLVASIAPAGPPGADTASPVRAASEAPRGFWIQLGAFRERDGAQSFQRHVGDDNDSGWLAPLLATFADAALFRVQAGPYASRDEAEGAALRVRSSLGIVPLIVERR